MLCGLCLHPQAGGKTLREEPVVGRNFSVTWHHRAEKGFSCTILFVFPRKLDEKLMYLNHVLSEVISCNASKYSMVLKCGDAQLATVKAQCFCPDSVVVGLLQMGVQNLFKHKLVYVDVVFE